MHPLSPSQGKVFLDCPWAWREQYKRKFPTLQSDPMKFGTIVHEAIQSYVDHLMQTQQQKAQLDIPKVWEDFVAKRPKGIPDRFYEESRRLLERFAEKFVLELDHVWKTEARLALDINGNPVEFFADNVFLRGIADLVLVYDGYLAVVKDWKTARTPISEEKMRGDLQANTYPAMMFKLNPAITVVRVEFVYPRAGSTTTVEFTKAEGEATWNRWLETSSRLDKALTVPDDKKVWAATPGEHCRICNVAARCPLGMVKLGVSQGVAVTQESAEEIAKRLMVMGTVEKMLTAGLKAWVDSNGALVVDGQVWDFHPSGFNAKAVKALCEKHFVDPMTVLTLNYDALQKAADKDKSFGEALTEMRTSTRETFGREQIAEKEGP